MATQQRLIVCFDGTWNEQDSSTNVLHHFNLVHEGAVAGANGETIIQKKYYHQGVGTSVLDRVTGGGFGFGLEKNVRDGYNWLVQNYCDPDGKDSPADEIYIFGFSRGAYTARSLVGFIGQCGLLRRAAPLTVNQLWSDYCILGRNREGRSSVWDKLFWQSLARCRPITDLVRDPWLRQTGGMPAAGARSLNNSERLLVRWSRRVKITYLGVYDTVGAIGWDALAIPGLTSHIALHNNMRPTTLIQHCRHALAVDEHRSSFNHTPFLAFVGHDSGEREEERGEDAAPLEGGASRRQYWDRTRAMWQRKIEQRWFVGAHSNIGGGYEDNRLAEIPLNWILDGAADVGLESESVASDSMVTPGEQSPRDSFAEFASPVWTKILRAKRNYRLIDPDPFPQASTKAAKNGDPAPGFSLQTIHEDVDDSVFGYWDNSPSMPPNLYEYACRRGPEAAQKPAHPWLKENVVEYVALILWATIAAAGLAALYRLAGWNPSDTARLWGAGAVAFLLPWVDWSESAVNFRCALGFGGGEEGNRTAPAAVRPRARAFLDAIYWTRAFGVVLFLCGLVPSVIYLMQLGWWHLWPETAIFAQSHWPVPLLAAAAAVLAARFRSKAAWVSLVLGPAAVAGTGALVMAAAWFASHLFLPTGRPEATGGVLSVPGLLLLLQLTLIYFWRSLLWTGEPMAQAKLGSIVPLQRCPTPAKVTACLERWRRMLECRWLDDNPVTGPAANRMREVVRESLWRDIIGLIPVYSGLFLFALWFAAWLGDQNHQTFFAFLKWPGGLVALWWLIPLIAAATDYAEDICHLRFIALHEQDKEPSSLLAFFSWSMSRIKGVAVVVALLLTVAAVIDGTFLIWRNPADWRAKIAILLSAAFLCSFALYALGRIVHLFDPADRRVSRPPDPAPVSRRAGASA